MKIVIATENPHKLQELQQILPSALPDGTPIEYQSMRSFLLSLPAETGTTLAENARQKAVYVAQETGLMALSDDTGLEVDFLDGGPGVYTARYAGEHGNAQANNQKLLTALKGVALPKRTAHFKTVACLARPDGTYKLFEGIVQGFIAEEYHGQNGFGYDPLFVVEETGKTFAEMTTEEKNAVSHRGRAFAKLAKWMKQNL